MNTVRFLLPLLLTALAAGCPGDSPTVLKRDGEPDVLSVADDDSSMNDAIQKARETVQTFIDRVEADDGSAQMMFKAKFTGGDQDEHMWVSNVRVEDGELVGILNNEPAFGGKGVSMGDEVREDPSKVSDWMIIEADRKLTGGYTIRVLRDGMEGEEREAFDASVDFTFD